MPVYPRHLVNDTGRAFYADPFAADDFSAYTWGAGMALLESFATTKWASGYSRSIAAAAQQLRQDNPGLNEEGIRNDEELLWQYAPQKIREIQQGNRQLINEFNERYAAETASKFAAGGFVSDIGVFGAQMAGFMADPVNTLLSFTPVAPVKWARTASKITKAGLIGGRNLRATADVSTRQGLSSVLGLATKQGLKDAAYISPFVAFASLMDYETHLSMGAEVGEAAEIAAYRLIDIPATFAFRAASSVALDYGAKQVRRMYRINGKEIDEPTYDAFVRALDENKDMIQAKDAEMQPAAKQATETMKAEGQARVAREEVQAKIQDAKARTEASLSERWRVEQGQRRAVAERDAQLQSTLRDLGINLRTAKNKRERQATWDSAMARLAKSSRIHDLRSRQSLGEDYDVQAGGVLTRDEQGEIARFEAEQAREEAIRKTDRETRERQDAERYRDPDATIEVRGEQAEGEPRRSKTSVPGAIFNAIKAEKNRLAKAKGNANEEGLPVIKRDVDQGNVPLSKGELERPSLEQWQQSRKKKIIAREIVDPTTIKVTPEQEAKLRARAEKLGMTYELLRDFVLTEMREAKEGHYFVYGTEIDDFLARYKKSDRDMLRKAMFREDGMDDHGNVVYSLTDRFKWIPQKEFGCGFGK